ncbi:hypothetical protein AMS68_007618 [Peltaster fructicola]|uniref:Zn(2)-C6 fungal-type domain-containing protein n=1 Tax=Peltaster fructicola TaxID=286661 RepID=A0A6H0Y5A2_9PEZI|nr:hypothetical protein AMS68_007618 [Peltaster fructicola]
MIATLQPRFTDLTTPHAQDTRLKPNWNNRPSDSATNRPCPVPSGCEMETPRPLELRASHERTSSTQDTRYQHVYGNAQPLRAQTLPGVRDILTPPSAQPTYSHQDNWRAGPPPSQHYFREHTYHAQPPAAYPPRPEYTTQDRRLELPVLETRPLPGLPPSPYTSLHTEAGRDYDARPRQLSGGSYARDSVISPYTPYEENGVRSYERHLAGPPIVSTDPGKRYVIEDTPEGQYYVYENGHRVPVEVDGERVNPQWGLTKANKPRKRLAMACMDCREKKIRCDQRGPTCLQCEKAKRVCKMYDGKTHASVSTNVGRARSNHSQHDVTEWSSNGGSPPPARTTTAGAMAIEPGPHHRDAEMDMLQKRRAQDELATNAIKRQKSASPATIHNIVHMGVNGSSMAPRPFSEEVDPFIIDSGLTMHLLELYFDNINSGVYSLFPREPFMRWVISRTEKSPTDRMVLHAMMATASIFRPQQHSNVGEHCAALAVAALNAKFGKFSLGLIHIRLLLALYNFAKNSRGMAWEHCGAAMRAISALRFNNEEGCSTGPDADPTGTKEYGLTYNQAVECRRRTFWCGFMMDRFNGFCEGMLCTVDKADVYLRLPCAESTFDVGARSQAPFFDNGIVDRADAVLTSVAPVAPMAHLALITSIWGDVMNFVYRGFHRSSSGHAAAYEAFYADTYRALTAWSSRLPTHLVYSEENHVRSVRERYSSDFVTMHILHQYALLKLNRCMRWSLMPESVARNISEAHTHAHQLLGIVSRLATARNDGTNSPAAHARCYSFSTPFVGFAVVSAVDVISAGGPDDNLKPTISSMRDGLAFLQELAPYWISAVDQAKAVEKRFYQLNNVVSRPYKAVSGCWLGRKWGLEDPLERELDLKDDCIYGVEGTVYFEALEKLKQNGFTTAKSSA